MRNEILVDDNLWGEFYSVVIPGSGTLTAEWGNGKIEQADIEVISFDRWGGLNRVQEKQDITESVFLQRQKTV